VNPEEKNLGCVEGGGDGAEKKKNQEKGTSRSGAGISVRTPEEESREEKKTFPGGDLSKGKGAQRGNPSIAKEKLDSRRGVWTYKKRHCRSRKGGAGRPGTGAKTREREELRKGSVLLARPWRQRCPRETKTTTTKERKGGENRQGKRKGGAKSISSKSPKDRGGESTGSGGAPVP